MAHRKRYVLETPEPVGADETVNFVVDVSPWGTGTPTNQDSKLYRVDGNTETDVTSTNLSGPTLVNSTLITSADISGLTAGERYILKWLFDLDGRSCSAKLEIHAEF